MTRTTLTLSALWTPAFIIFAGIMAGMFPVFVDQRFKERA